MKKSTSFHAFSNELPTLVEVEEQLDNDPFHYNGHHHYYLNNPFYHQHLQQQQQQHGHHQGHHHHHSNNYANNHLNSGVSMNNQFNHLNSSSYFSLPHSQTFNDFADSNANNKNKITASLSTSNLNQTFNMNSNLAAGLQLFL